MYCASTLTILSWGDVSGAAESSPKLEVEVPQATTEQSDAIELPPEYAEPIESEAYQRKEQARELFARGLELSAQAEYQEALEAFRKALELSPHHSVLLNIARIYQRLGERKRAIEFFRAYLQAGEGLVSEVRQAEVEAAILALEAEPLAQNEQKPKKSLSGSATFRMRVFPSHALVRVDGKRLARGAGALKLPHGKHLVEVSLRGYVSRRVALDLMPGEVRTVDISLSREISAAREQGLSSQRVVGVSLGAAGIALLGTTVGLFVWNDQRHRSWKREQQELSQSSLPAPDLAERRAASDQELYAIQRTDTVTWVTGIAGGAMVALGGLGYFVQFPSPQREIALSISGLHYRERF
jgi:hypothetical protein